MSYSEALELQAQLYQRWKNHSTWERQFIRRLPFADTYWLSSTVQPLVLQAARTLPEKTQIDLATPPSPEGFVMLDTPFGVKVNDGHETRVMALQWLPSRIVHDLAEPIGGGSVVAPGDIDSYSVMMYVDYGLILPSIMSQWAFGATLRDMVRVQNERRADNMTDDDVLTGVQGISIWAALGLFVQQRILISSHTRAERHSRKRLERLGWDQNPVVRVIELRKKQARISHAVEPVEAEWSCQWIVRGHWRQQYYPSKNLNQPVWITPYVKGPENKPLRPPRATVFAVVR